MPAASYTSMVCDTLRLEGRTGSTVHYVKLASIYCDKEIYNLLNAYESIGNCWNV